MSTIHHINNPASNEVQIAFVKGAPKEVLSFCTPVLRGGQEQLLNENLCRQIMAANDEYAGRGLRVLAVARRWLSNEDMRHLFHRYALGQIPRLVNITASGY